MIWTKLKKDVILEKIKKGFILISVLSVLFQNGGGVFLCLITLFDWKYFRSNKVIFFIG